MFDNLIKLKLETFEHCYCLEDITDTEVVTDIKVNIPKLMPLIPVDYPKNTKYPIDSSIFVNDALTKPIVNRTITNLNYLKAKKTPNGSSSMRQIDSVMGELRDIIFELSNICEYSASVSQGDINNIKDGISSITSKIKFNNTNSNIKQELSKGDKLVCTFINSNFKDRVLLNI